MTKVAGYTVTIKAFIPSSRTDFAAQAKAATAMAELIAAKVITPGFVELATIIDVSGKFGSAELPELPDIDPADMDGPPDADAPTEHETPPAPRQKRGASQG